MFSISFQAKYEKISDDTLLSFVKNLPELEEIVTEKGSIITINGIKKALEYGKHLLVLIVDTKKITINLDDFKSIWSS